MLFRSACQNRYAALLPEVEEHEAFDIMEGIDNATAEDDREATDALREVGAVKEPPRKRSRLRAGAKAFKPREPAKFASPGVGTSGKSREELLAASHSQKMQMRKEITKLRAEAASFRPSRKEPERLPPISVPTHTQRGVEVRTEIHGKIRSY